MSSSQASVAARPSADAHAMMMFDSRKKSVLVAYVFWLFFAGVGAHRFYAGKTFSGLAMLSLFVCAWLLVLVFVGIYGLAALGIWIIVDAFLIPGWIRDYNSRLATELGTGGIGAGSHKWTSDDSDADSGAGADAIIARHLSRRSAEPTPTGAIKKIIGEEGRPVAKSFGTRVRAP
jgi:TM2 domain-containing membrane protein YozV